MDIRTTLDDMLKVDLLLLALLPNDAPLPSHIRKNTALGLYFINSKVIIFY